MQRLDKLRLRLRSLVRRGLIDQELDAELQFYLDHHIEESLAAGLSPDEARRAALRSLGSVTRVKEECRDARGLKVIDDLAQDIRYGLRTLIKNPRFTLVAILTLGLGLGANTAMFSVVNAALLRPLPYPEPDRLVKIVGTNTREGTLGNLSPADFADLDAASDLFESMTAHGWVGFFTIAGDGEPERISGSNVTYDFFQTLGVEPLLGRAFRPKEDERGLPRVAIISHAFWGRRFGSDPSTLGRVVNFNAIPTTIVGILPPDYRHPEPNPEREPDAYIPFWWDPAQPNRVGHFIRAIGRLTPGVTLDQARAELTTLATRLEQEYPDNNTDRGVHLSFLLDAIVQDTRLALLLLLGAVGFVLLVACANIANLLLASGSARQKELAIRAALGAGRRRLIRQLLTESLLLSVGGGIIGLAVASWAMQMLTRFSATLLPRAEGIQLDSTVLGFTAALACLTGLVFGLAPALQLSRADVHDSLKDGTRGQAGHARRRARELLIVAEVALSLVLLVGAGLLLQSLWRLQNVDPGFRPECVLTLQMSLPFAKYEEGEQIPFYEQLYERLRPLPGVDVVGAINILPLSQNYDGNPFQIDDRPVPVAQAPGVQTRSINPAYFRAMGIPLIRGREFNDRDTADSPGVAIISDRMAERYWPGEDPIGKRITYNRGTFEEETQTVGGPGSRDIVGIVGSVKHLALEDDVEAMFYTPQTQQPSFHTMTLVLRGSVERSSLTARVRHALAAMDPDVPIFAIRTLDAMLDSSVAQPTLRTVLLGLFAGLALLLSLVGIYGVIGHLVGQRTLEIGIRMALGARSLDVIRMLVAQGMIPVFVGIGIGLAAAYALSRILASLLFAVTATDPLTYVVVALVLGAAALAATCVPAMHATQIDPSTALRAE